MVNKRDLITWVILFVLAFMLVYLAFFTQSESYKCLSSPLTYGVSLYESNVGEFTCTCSFPNTNPVIVTKNNVTPMNQYYNSFNFSLLES